jgi:hypothetical protein
VFTDWKDISTRPLRRISVRLGSARQFRRPRKLILIDSLGFLTSIKVRLILLVSGALNQDNALVCNQLMVCSTEAGTVL